MRLPVTRDQAIRLGRFVAEFEAIAVLVAFLLAVVYAGLTGSAVLDAFYLTTFLIFLLVLFYGVLSGPGMFLSRPRFTPFGPGSSGRLRQLFAAPPISRDREFYELVLYTGLAFLLLAIATAIGALAQALGG